MNRAKIWLFGGLAAAGTVVIVLVAAGVVGEAKTSLDVAVLAFTGLAAAIGWLGLIVSWLTYQLEAGRVPRPDVRIIDEGSLTSHWTVHLMRVAPAEDTAGILEREREELARAKEVSRRPKAKGSLADLVGASSFLFPAPSEDDLRRYDERVEEYIPRLERFLIEKRSYDEFWSISRPLLLAFTNDKGGAPADGVLIRLHFPDKKEGLVVHDVIGVPDKPPQPPARPAPPKGSSLLDQFLVQPMSFPDFIGRGLGSIEPIAPPGNVSGPDFEEGSVLVKYTVAQILHNVPEDNRDESLLVSFMKPGTWEIPYEVHARNLQAHRTGLLRIEAIYDEPSNG
jgi:hypothetical protein